MKGKDNDSPSKRKRKNPFFKAQNKKDNPDETAPNDSEESFEFVDCADVSELEPKVKTPKPGSTSKASHPQNVMTASQQEKYENLRQALREYMNADPTANITIVRDGNVMHLQETVDQIMETGNDDDYFIDMPLENLANIVQEISQRNENLSQIHRQLNNVQENVRGLANMLGIMNETAEKTKNKIDRTFTNARKTEHYGRFLVVSDLQRRERNNEPELPFKEKAPENLFFRRIEQAYGYKLNPNYRFAFQCPQCEYITNGEQDESEEEEENDDPLPYDHPAKKDRFKNDFDHDQGGSGSGIAA